MKINRRVALGAAVMVLLMIWGIMFRSRLEDRLIVVNKSGQEISELEIKAGEQAIEFGKVAHNQTVTRTTDVRDASKLSLNGRLADGTRFALTANSVKKGWLGQEANFTILPGGSIQLQQK